MQKQGKRVIADMVENHPYTVALLKENPEDSWKHISVLKYSHTKRNSLETT